MSKPGKDISSQVLDQIKQGKVQMRPRIYYMLLSAVSVLAVISAGISLAYLFSIAFFWVRIQTAGTFAWGARANLSEAIATFPWWALGISILLSAVAVALIRHQGRLYRHRTSILVVILVTLSLLLGLVFYSLGIGRAGHTPFGEPRAPGWRQNQ